MATSTTEKKPKHEVRDEDLAPITPDPISLKDRVVSVGLWAVGSAWITAAMGALIAAQKFWDSDTLEPGERVYIRGQLLLLGSKWRSVVHPKVDPKTQYFFLQNHINHFDHCSMYNATPHFKQGVELVDHFKYPVYGPFMKGRGTIPVVKGAKNMYERLATDVTAELARGHSILAFPEGTRTTTGRVGKFKPGMFKVAVATGTPIVPVAVTGMYDVMRKGSLVIRPGFTITVYYEEPIETKGLTEADIPWLMNKTRDAIAARVDAYWRERGKL
jgi:1-acyl-sn-glycerol-3-phosphate acyltransferase